MVDAGVVLEKYFRGEALCMIMAHGSAVSALSIAIARNVGLGDGDLRFVEEAGMLHDIGVCRVRAPELGLYGDNPYMMHGVLGRGILEAEGLPRHALVCERHIGVGLTGADIVSQGLPLPVRDMVPQTVPEEIVCFADLFYSKAPGRLTQIQSVGAVRKKLAVFGEEKTQLFDSWLSRFGGVFAGRSIL